ncbi:MAG: DUF4230 domain-containing protein [Prevotella sp.]|nr:DUF4230 domain-containing protein [Prevotella sp.]
MKKKFIIIAAIMVVIAVGTLWFCTSLSKTEISLTQQDDDRLSPTLITSIQDIGEWEFLSIHDEELVDTVRRGIFSDDELIRIYYGTLRLGMNMKKVRPHWIRTEGDSISITLPPVALLDDEFIDEARTMAFYESGSWSNEDREAMYHRAEAKMRQRCLTAENMRTAEGNATQQFRQLLRSMGFKRIGIDISEQ